MKISPPPIEEREQCWLFPKDLPRDLNKRFIGHEWAITSLKARYLFAGSFLKTGFILDCACGSGAGTEILRRAATYICSSEDVLWNNVSHLLKTTKSLVKSALVFKKLWGSPEIFRKPTSVFPKPKVFGVDISTPAVRFAKHYYPANFFQVGDICKLSFHSEVFDSVVSFETMEHLDDIQMAISETHRVLKSNGLFIGSIPIDHPNHTYHKEVYSSERVVELFSKTYRNPLFFGMKQNGFIYWGGPKNSLLNGPQMDYVLILAQKD